MRYKKLGHASGNHDTVTFDLDDSARRESRRLKRTVGGSLVAVGEAIRSDHLRLDVGAQYARVMCT